MKDGFIKIACASPEVRVADCEYNAGQIIDLIKKASGEGVHLVALPELCITGYTCGDLFLQRTLLDGAMNALMRILTETAELDIIAVVGVPVRHKAALYNCGAVCHKGKLLGLVPKQNIPNHSELNELRYFTPFTKNEEPIFYEYNENGLECLLSAEQVFVCKDSPEFSFGVEICEDLWVSDSPSVRMAAGGANIILNLSCSDETVGKAEYRRTIIKAKSGSLLCAYAYADAGLGESTQDMVFAGHNIIAENGTILAESELFTNSMIITEVDVQKLQAERLRSNTFTNASEADITEWHFSMPVTETELTREILPSPFIPKAEELDSRCASILKMQAVGLASRMKHIGCKNAVVGLSGGLDSTLALIVTARAFDMLGLPRNGILAVTMPCFGTTDRTYSNACRLARSYGAELREVRIADSVRQHFKDIGQDESNHDVTYENAQARERTQVLMDIANQIGGIVIGTGDLSELALGWATYNGDHMSMYGVNASIPKTLVRHLTAYEAKESEDELKTVLLDVLDTPVSPELLPPEKDGTIAQKTEDLVGPYELHDFILYYVIRFGFSPKKIYRLARIAFEGRYDSETILKWLRKFYWRFFSQQFKRSCLPDGPKVGSVSLSPRGDWRMPSDACVTLWQREIDEIDK